MIHKNRYWDRMILLVDMNAFFASVEQRDHPEWQGQPVVITNGSEGTTIITSSYEARAHGVKTGMRLPEARRLCPRLIRIPSRPNHYAEVSTAIMRALYSITPLIEIFSVDEAFLDVTGCQRLLGTAEQIGALTKKTVLDRSGLLCSVGISGDKSSAKYAAKQKKPNGLTIIPPWESEERLRDAPVTDLCGINRGIGDYLAQYGVRRCGEMKRIPIHILSRRFGNLGKRIWLMAQGKDPEPLITRTAPPKSIGHGKVTPPGTRERETILTYLHHMSEKVGARLRRHGMVASQFHIGFKTAQGWQIEKPKTSPTDDGRHIYRLARETVQSLWSGEGVNQVQVTALNPVELKHQQLELFTEPPNERREINAVTDQINRRYGEFTLAPASILNRSSMPNVISPAWRPDGDRKSI